MTKTTVYIALALGAQQPAYPAYVAFRSPFRFVSGNTVVLPEPAPVALAADGTGTVAVDPGIWLVDEILPTQVFRRAVVVPESTGVVQYANLIEVTNPVELGYGPSWAAIAQQAALAATLARDEVLEQILELAKGEPGGVATLDDNGLIPDEQMPARLAPKGMYRLVGELLDDRDIPGQITAAIADAGTVIAAATEAVGTALDIVGVVYGSRQKGYYSETTATGGFVDEGGRITDLVHDAQGKVLDLVMDEWADRLVARLTGRGLIGGAITGFPAGLGGGFADQNGRATELVHDLEGNVPDSVLLDRWAPRIAPRLLEALPPTPAYLDARLQSNRGLATRDAFGQIVPFVSDPLALAAWGDSLTDGWPRPPFLLDQSNAWPAVFDASWAGTVYNGGVTGQSADEIALRQGGYVLLCQAFEIPASGPVNVTTDQVFAWRLDRGWSCAGTIAGIAGTLSRSGSTLTFTRNAAGVAIPVAKGTPFISTPGEAHKYDMQVYFAGRNDLGYTSPAGSVEYRIVAAHVAMAERAGAVHKRFLTVGTITNTAEVAGNATHTLVTRINNTLKRLYPDNYFDLRDYLAHQAIYDMGLTPTATDLARMNADTLPPQIMANYDPATGAHDGVHYSVAAAAAVANKLKAVMAAKGWIS